jgi:undecaprenyl-diphosphatase
VSVLLASLTPLEAAILGLVEGLTEYLPVSSTGHLILAAALLGKSGDPAVNAFNIIVQAGAILAVLGLYRARVVGMVRDLAHLPRHLRHEGWTGVQGAVRGGRLPGVRLATNLLLAFMPAAILGPLLDDGIESYLFFPIPVAAALAIGGLVIFAFEPLRKRRSTTGLDVDHLTARGALIIGFIQCLAMIPGTSRSLATILGGLIVGLHPAAAAAFSFLLGLPTLGGATVYKSVQDGQILLEGMSVEALVIGLVVATVSAAIAVKGFVSWLNRHGLVPFGVYRLILAVAVFFVMREAM